MVDEHDKLYSEKENSTMKYKLDNWVAARLAEPFAPEDLGWLPSFGGGRRGAYAYVSARAVVRRLDEIVGAENWSDQYYDTQVVSTEIRDTTNLEELYTQGIAKKGSGADGTLYLPKGEEWRKELTYTDISHGGTRCDLTILGVTKSDTGSPSYAEQLKGSYSDALKRAAVKFGVGEYLYRLGTLPAKLDYGRVVEPPELPDWALPKGRGSPDGKIKEMIDQVMDLKGLTDEQEAYIEDAIEDVVVMGSYFSRAPLIAKRYTYEKLSKLLAGETVENEEG